MRAAVILAAVASAGLAASACASATAIQLRGTPDACAALVGEWQGAYTARDRDSGTIWFKLAAGEDHAHGDVIMTRSEASGPYERREPGKGPSQPVPSVLAIRFVHVAGDVLDGMLEPYWDPRCECEAVTTFRGRVDGDRLSGTFVTRRGALESRGRWQMTRKRLTAE